MRGTTVITGATGYFGGRLAAELLRTGDDDLVLPVRAADDAELAIRRGELVGQLGAEAAGRVRVVPADLCDGRYLPGVDTRAVTRIVHAAAITRFSVERELADRVNVAGTVRVREFADRCANLRRFALVSTLYSVGGREGDVKEERFTDEAGFVNHYEWSKWAAEDHVLGASAADLPVSVLRLPTLIADDDTGRVTQYNAFHNTMKLFYYGLLSVVPGDEHTPLSLASVSFGAAATARLLEPDVSGGIYHVCPDPDDAPTLGEIIDIAFTAYEADETFRRRALLRPVHCDRASFEDLVAMAERLRGGPIHQSLSTVSPFATQLYLPKTFRNDGLRAVWPEFPATDTAALARATCARLVDTRWGRRP